MVNICKPKKDDLSDRIEIKRMKQPSSERTVTIISEKPFMINQKKKTLKTKSEDVHAKTITSELLEC